MSGVTKADIPNESAMMGMLWSMIKDFYIPEDNDEYWLQIVERANQIDGKCHSRLGQMLIMTFCDYLEEKQRNQKGAENGQKFYQGKDI